MMNYVSAFLSDEELTKYVRELLDCIVRAERESKQNNYSKKNRADCEDKFGVAIQKVNTKVIKMLGEDMAHEVQNSRATQ